MSAPTLPAPPPRGSPWASPGGWHASQTVLAPRRMASNPHRLPDPIPAATPRLIRQPGEYAHVSARMPRRSPRSGPAR